MLAILIGLSQSISREGCGAQLFLPWFCYHELPSASSNGVWGLGGHLQPTSLVIIMNWKVCAMMAPSVCATGFSLPFCNTWIEHFFCGVRRMLDLACATPVTNDILILVISLLAITVPATFLFISYVLIISTILEVASVESWKKTHTLYGCVSIAYFKPKSENTEGQDQLISGTYSVITPLLNPVEKPRCSVCSVEWWMEIPFLRWNSYPDRNSCLPDRSFR